MITKHFLSAKSLLLGLSIGAATVLSSCTSTYDPHGRPTQTVDPGVAIAGAAAAGLVGYAIANNRQKSKQRQNHYNHGYNRHHQPRHYHHPRHGRRY